MFKNINKVVQILVTIDFFVNGAFGSFGPVFAVFITSQISSGSLSVAGFAASAYWITKSIIQLPIAHFLDKTDGERDEFWALFLGYIFFAFVPIMYIFATKPWHLYLIQAFLGVCMAFAVPAWYSIFTRHVDKERIGFEWSLQSVFAVGLTTAIAAAVGGVLADKFGFKILFLMAGIVILISSIFLWRLRKNLWSKTINHETA